MADKFLYGTIGVVEMENNESFLVGVCKGKIKAGDKVFLTNRGDDNEECEVETTIKEVTIKDEKGWKIVSEAGDGLVGLKLEKCEFELAIGTVIYNGDVTLLEKQDTYISALGDGYIANLKLNIEDYLFDYLSMADLAEIWRLNEWYNETVLKNRTDDEKRINAERINKVCANLCAKIREAKSFYAVYSTETGAPYLFMDTVAQGGGYACSPANIRIIPYAYRELFDKDYSNDKFELRLIEEGSDGKGILNFFGTSFFVEGADGVEIISKRTVIQAEALIKRPDNKKVDEKNVPIANPQLVKWIHVIGQTKTPETDTEKEILSLYYSFVAKEIQDVKLLIPVQKDPDKEGPESIKMMVAANPNGRPAVKAYTDIKNLLLDSKDVAGCVMNSKTIIEDYDIALNFSKYKKSGCLINKNLYNAFMNMDM